MMLVVWAIALLIVNAVWLATVLVGLPGNWLMVLSTLLVVWLRPAASAPPMFSYGTLLAIVALATAGEVLEFIAGAVGTKRAGGSKRGAKGALIGGLIGALIGTVAIPIPVIGSLLGACIGAAIGAAYMELSGGRSTDESLRAGLGAGVGRFAGSVAKFGVGIVIWLVVAVAAFWP